jgi:hypothetical protein
LGVSGNASRNTKADGTMWLGNRFANAERKRSTFGASLRETTYATRRRACPSSSRATTTASRTESNELSAASISPSSTR